MRVLSAEIAHNLAHHVAENMSRNSLFVLGVLGVSFFLEISTDLPRLVGQLVFNLPGSRKQEVRDLESGVAVANGAASGGGRLSWFTYGHSAFSKNLHLI